MGYSSTLMTADVFVSIVWDLLCSYYSYTYASISAFTDKIDSFLLATYSNALCMYQGACMF